MSGSKRTSVPSVYNAEDQMWREAYEYLTDTEVARFTPDLPFLQTQYMHLFFVVDQSIEHLYSEKDNALHLGYGFTRDKYSFWRKKLGLESFGIPLQDCKFHAVPEARIKGQLFAVATWHVKELDFYYQNGVLFERKRIKVVIPYVKEITRNHTVFLDKRSCFLDAWVYLGVRNYWYPQLDSGYRFAPVKVFQKEKLGDTLESKIHELPYTRWTNLEYKDI